MIIIAHINIRLYFAYHLQYCCSLNLYKILSIQQGTLIEDTENISSECEKINKVVM